MDLNYYGQVYMAAAGLHNIQTNKYTNIQMAVFHSERAALHYVQAKSVYGLNMGLHNIQTNISTPTYKWQWAVYSERAALQKSEKQIQRCTRTKSKEEKYYLYALIRLTTHIP
jgi:hypothetical protein